jgi:anti-sigma regulatory factor (Ser/Thr protein kinase)
MVKKRPMAPELYRQYAAVLGTAAQARNDLAAFLREHNHEAIVSIATLMVSELATNSIIHATGPITMRAHLNDHTLRVNIDDTHQQLPQAREPDSNGGRGLHMIATLATQWGTAPIHGAGKTTWFTIRTGTQHQHRG